MSWRGRTAMVLIGCGAAAGATWYGVRAYRGITEPKQVVIPVAKVQRGDLTLTVTAKGELRGGNPEVLTAPMIGGTDLHLTTLRASGEPVTGEPSMGMRHTVSNLGSWRCGAAAPAWARASGRARVGGVAVTARSMTTPRTMPTTSETKMLNFMEEPAPGKRDEGTTGERRAC